MSVIVVFKILEKNESEEYGCLAVAIPSFCSPCDFTTIVKEACRSRIPNEIQKLYADDSCLR